MKYNSDFDMELAEWEDNRGDYRGIRPDYASGKWRSVAQKGGLMLNKSFDTLTEAKEAVTKFRQSAGEGDT